MTEERTNLLMAKGFPQYTRAEVEADLTYVGAMGVIRAARRMLADQLTFQEDHEHMGDDCGDYLDAASTNWHRLWEAYFVHDGDEQTVIDAVRAFLLEPVEEWLGSDGEIRFEIMEESEWQV